MKFLIIAAAAFGLVGCGVPLTVGGPAPAPLEKTTIDDRALLAAWQSHDAFQDALNLWIEAKPSIVGTPQAKRVADINDAITAALQAAEAAVAAGSTTDYAVAIAQVTKATVDMRVALAALKGVK